MESAFAWIGQFVEWIGRWFPRWVNIDPTEGGVKFVGSLFNPAKMKVIVLGPGIHWWWPVTTKFEPWPVARQADNLPTQTIVTKDDKVVAVSGMLVYAVDDLGKLFTSCHEPVKLIQDIALTEVHDVCCKMSWDQLKDEQRKGTLDTKLKNNSQKALTDYGVRVIKCMLTDLAPTRCYKIIQATQKDE